MRFLTRNAARDLIRAEGVPIGETSLKDHASRGTGPKFSIINGRALYKPEDVQAWIASKAEAPARESASGRQVEGGATTAGAA